ncbi:MAG: diversity-generating retroelement protein Avd [bacterium]
MAQEAIALTKAYDVVKWIMERAAKFPKSRRYSLGARMEDIALDILMKLVEANYSRKKAELLQQTNHDIDKMRYLVRLSKDFNLLSIKQHEYISKELIELGRQVGGWSRHARERDK